MLKNKTDLFTQHVVLGRRKKKKNCVVDKGTLVLLLLLSPNLCAFISADLVLHICPLTLSVPSKRFGY